MGSYFRYSPFLLPLLLVLMVLAGLHLRQFSFDASSDNFVAEGDEALAYYQEISSKFSSDSFIYVTWEPREGSLFAEENLTRLAAFQDRLAKIDGTSGVLSLLDAPLLQSPPVPVGELADGFTTLRAGTADKSLAEKELRESPLYSEQLVSGDGKAAMLRLSLIADERLEMLRTERNRLRSLPEKTGDSRAALRLVESDYAATRRSFIAAQDRLMEELRSVREEFSGQAEIHLTGVPMVASDMIRYVKRDALIFGGASLALILVFLAVIFQGIRWVILPLLTALMAAFLVAGLLGFLRQPVTVISANFLPLILIFSISLTVHILVRMRELSREAGDSEMIREQQQAALAGKFRPSLYTALTTIVAFASLMAGGIIPVRDFGWIMCVSMIAAFGLNFTLFPALLTVLPARAIPALPRRSPVLTDAMRFVSTRLPWLVVTLAAISIAGAVWGIGQLSTDSRFIDYFRKDSGVREGLVYTDKNFGGTTPMDVIIEVAPFVPTEADEEDDFFVDEPESFPERYWYTPDKIVMLRKFHAWLDARNGIGKVVSLATLEEIARDINDSEALNSIELAAVIGAIPDDLRAEFLGPYSSPEEGILRLSMRIEETAAPNGSRDELIEGIEQFAVNEVGLPPEAVKVTGVNVLFNNMLKTLIRSQIATIGLVILATWLMLVVLLRSFGLALIGILPNVLAAMFTLGLMGAFGITLDMMTITIAAVIVGIGVDNAIHYLFRFRQEIAAGRSTAAAIEASHDSVGFALYYTAVTIIGGFSILGLSSFVPTVWFGLLTAAAMAMSILANLMIAPALLMIFHRDKVAG